MKLKALTLLAMLIAGTVVAQDKYGATEEEQKACKEKLSLYREFRKQKLYADAVGPWREACKICPKSAKTLYTDGVKFYRQFIKEAKDDEARQEGLIDTLFMVYDWRIENFGQEGYVLGRKGADMIRYRKNDPKPAIETLRKSVELRGNKSEAGALSAYYMALYAGVVKKVIEKRELLDEYLVISDLLDYNINNAEDEKSKENYEKAKNNVDELFVKVAKCEDVVDVVKTRYAESPDDQETLTKCVKILSKRECTDDAIYFEVASKLQSLAPSIDAARGLGLYSLKNKKYADAIKYYKQAIEMNTDGNNIADDYYRLAQGYFGAGNYQSTKTYAIKAVSERGGWGAPYILIGDAITYSAKGCGTNEIESKSVHWLAYDYYAKAKADASSAADAGKRMGGAKANWPNKETLFNYGLINKEGTDYTVPCWGENTKVRLAQ